MITLYTIVSDLINSPRLVPASFVVGVVLHLGYFMHGEHHMLAYRYLQALVGFSVAATLYLVYHGAPPVDAVGLVAALISTLLFGLFTSMVIYRGIFHRLGSFPGPRPAKYSKLWHVWTASRSVRNFEEMDKLHQKYGPFVRIGPNELSIVHPDAMEVVHGPASKCSKGTWYDSTPGLTSMHSTRSRKLHDLRRRSWAKGFSAQALRDYEPRVELFTQSLTHQLAARTGRPLNASQWFNYYSFDVMGDLAYGKSFNMLETGDAHWAIDLLIEGIHYMGTIGQAIWAVIIFTQMPIITRNFRRFLAFCEKMIDDRVAERKTAKDISSWIINAPSMAGSGYTDKGWLLGDSRLVIVAGSDTTAATLTHLFYHLAREPAHVESLRQELVPLKEEYSFTSLQKLTFLNGLINETLRLHPPVPSGTQRMTPPEGIQLGDTYIPGGVNIIIPFYSMFRAENCFERASEFLPDRWDQDSKYSDKPGAFAPFSSGMYRIWGFKYISDNLTRFTLQNPKVHLYLPLIPERAFLTTAVLNEIFSLIKPIIGPYSCIGKQLALMELRSVCARLVTDFDVTLAPGEDGTNLLTKTEDCFTMHLAPLKLLFTLRKHDGL